MALKTCRASMATTLLLLVCIVQFATGALALGTSGRVLQQDFVEESDPGRVRGPDRKKPRRPDGVHIPFPPKKLDGDAASRCKEYVIPVHGTEPSTKPCCAFFEDLGQPLVLNCAKGTECVRKNGFYGACLPPDRKKTNIEENGWEGAVLPCGEQMSVGCPDLNCRGKVSDPKAKAEMAAKMKAAQARADAVAARKAAASARSG